MTAILNNAVIAGVVRPIDAQFAWHMSALTGETRPQVLLATSLLSCKVGDGDVCLDLATYNKAIVTLTGTINLSEFIIPSIEVWYTVLTGSPLVGLPGSRNPLILDRDRLYLERYWRFEFNLANALNTRIGTWQENVDLALLSAGLDRLFPATDNDEFGPDWQKIAAAMAVLRSLCIISGGPGTGKTHTVTAILALLIEQTKKQTPQKLTRIALSAPTGKAAARLTESINNRKSELAINSDIAAAIPNNAITLHRLLGFIPGKSEPRYGANLLLPLDVLVVDEVSMLDLPMMARLLAALPISARLILLGDKHQLAPVEVGSVLGDLCGHGTQWNYSQHLFTTLKSKLNISIPITNTLKNTTSAITIADHKVVLQKSRRFHDNSGIGTLAQAINGGNGLSALRILEDEKYPDVTLCTSGIADLRELLQKRIVPVYKRIFAAATPIAALQALNSLRVLCAVRDGPFGVNAINNLVEDILTKAGLIKPDMAMYAGRPLLITTNDYTQKLYNGDVGLVLQRTENSTNHSDLRVFFDTQDGIRQILPAKMPPCESVYAMTIHKSQGSEFDEVILVLPDTTNRLITRELIYTGLTRAKSKVTLYANPEIITQGIQRIITRSSGLKGLLANM